MASDGMLVSDTSTQDHWTSGQKDSSDGRRTGGSRGDARAGFEQSTEREDAGGTTVRTGATGDLAATGAVAVGVRGSERLRPDDGPFRPETIRLDFPTVTDRATTSVAC